MASGNIPLLEHRIVGTINSGRLSGSFPCPTTNNVGNITMIVIGYNEIYVLYCEPNNEVIRGAVAGSASSLTSRNMRFTISNGIISWTSDYQLYAPPVILY